MTRESKIQRDVQLALGSMPHVRLWRANVGLAIPVSQVCDDCRRRCRPVQFGVPGQADLTGIIGPVGRRLEVEVKSPTGSQSEKQRRFQQMVEMRGGLYAVVRSVDDALRAIQA